MDGSLRNVIDRFDLIGGAHGGKAGQVAPVDGVAEKVIACDVRGQGRQGRGIVARPRGACRARSDQQSLSFRGPRERADL